MTSMLSIGLMSGTSMDGIDVALLDTDGERSIKGLGHTSLTYTPAFKILLKAAEYAIRKHRGNIETAKENYSATLEEYLTQKLQHPLAKQKVLELTDYLQGDLSLDAVIKHSTDLHAVVVKKLLEELNYQTSQIALVGYHGQTLFHSPATQISIIVGDGQCLADRLQIPVVNDFRSNDIIAGGEGAPLAPIYHQALAVRDGKIPSLVINCGGIANITLIPNSEVLDLIAFDTGPGNGLIDNLVRLRTQGQENMDRDGNYAKQGKVIPTILTQLYEKAVIKNGKNYFDLLPPKSLDIGDLFLIPELDDLSLPDACATLAAFTADSIVMSLSALKINLPKHLILAGGGWNNPMILYELQARVICNWGETEIILADKIGWNSQALEAEIFAYLAVRSLKNKVLSVPGTTGVSQALSGGRIYNPIYF